MSLRNIAVTLLSLGLTAAPLIACGDDDTTTSGTADPIGASSTTGPTSTETSSPSTPAGGESTTATSGTAGTTSTQPAGGATVASIVAATQRHLDDEFAANPNPPSEVLGAIELSCDRSGKVAAGDLLACSGTPRTAPGFDLDPVGVIFAVLDDAGTVAWTTGTDLPDDGKGLDGLTASATPGLYCRDLVDPDAQAQTGFFDATSTNESLGYFLSVVYWFIEGRPDRMDEDGNGIPCETVHDPDVVAVIWRGGEVG